MESKARNLMNPEFMWDLTPVYANDEAWEADLKECEALAKRLGDIPGTLGNSAESLKNGLDRINEAARKVEKVYCYAFLKKSGDNGDARFQDMEARCISLIVQLQTAVAFVNPEILSIDPEKLEAYMKDENLATYRHMVEDVVRARQHTLDAQTEGILAMLGDAAQTPSNVFEMFESVDMRFPSIKDENGNDAPLTHGSFTVFRESKDARVRKDAFETYFGEFGKYINTLAAAYSGSVKQDCFFANVHHHAGACEAALFENNVPVSLYDSLVSAVHDALPTMKEYLALRKNVLGLEELNMYDLYVPMLESADSEVPFEKGREMVKAALKPLGEEYQTLLDRAFNEKWIDVYENQGKTTGAYSMGVFDAHPYVLLNYTDKLDDAFTLAHELGHAMHSYFSDSTQDFANHDYRIFVAEVASTVNEVLLTKYLLSKETDPMKRANLLNNFLESFRTTVFRQTLFAEFERKAHELYQAGTPLTAQVLNGVYRDLNCLYYDGAVINPITDLEWARIPHFYNAFYVYQYATGFCSAVAIADHILKTGDASDYLKFLSTGGSDYPLNELKIAGVDLTKPDTVANAMRVFKETLDELKEILGK
ncbi:MAG: oligoendopeptidase F [Clostridiales bacterium]|nr:oligoendopeptidase F [Clostridiales bacterium]